MTVAANDRRIQYTATSGQTVFPYDFQIDANTEVTVLQTVYTTGAINTLVLTTDYTVSGVGVSGGGNITLVTGAAINDTLTITGSTPLSRVTDFSNAGDFLASDLNNQFDKITRILQENETTANRAILLSDADTTTSLTLPVTSERASKFLAFNASGEAIASAGTTETPVSSFMATVLDDTTAAAARTTLDAQQLNTNLTALAGLTGAANKIPYFTGAGAMDLVDRVPAGSVVQSVFTSTSAVATGTTILGADDSIPQNTEGNLFLTADAITPTSATNLLDIEVILVIANATASQIMTVALFQDSTADALAAVESTTIIDAPITIPLRFRMVAGTISATTFKVRAGIGNSYTVTLNGFGGARKMGGVMVSSIKITEIQA
jgi:hypothetical protein